MNMHGVLRGCGAVAVLALPAAVFVQAPADTNSPRKIDRGWITAPDLLGGGLMGDFIFLRSSTRAKTIPSPAEPRGGCGCAGIGAAATWDGGGDGVSWSDPLNWSPNTAPGVAQFNFCATVAMGGPTVTLDVDVTICKLTVGMAATLNVDDAAGRTLAITDTNGLLSNNIINIQDNDNRVEAAGDITNNGCINITADAIGTAELVPTAVGTTLTTTSVGEVVLGTPGSARLGSTSALVSLINDVGHTIRGAGRIQGNFTNDGLVIADSSGEALLLSGAGTVRTNNSTVTATGGGRVRIGGTYEQGVLGITEVVSVGSILRMGDVGLLDASIEGGAVRQTAGLMTLFNRTLLKDLTVLGTMTALDMADEAYVEGTITNDGIIELASTGAMDSTLATRPPPTGGPATFAGTGSVQLVDAAHSVLESLAGVPLSSMTNGLSHTIEGVGVIKAQFVNNGLVSADTTIAVSGDTLTISPSGGATPPLNSASGTMQAGNSATLKIATTLTNAGAIEALSTGIVLIQANVTGIGTYTADGGTIRPDAGAGMISAAGSTLEAINGGLIEIIGDADFNLSGAVTINAASTYEGAVGASGTLTASSASILSGSGGPLGPTSGGEMVLTDSMSADIAGEVLIDGTADPCPPLALGCTPPILKVTDSASLQADTLTVLAGEAKLGDAGTIDIADAVTINQGGVVKNDADVATTTGSLTAGSVAILSDAGGSSNASALQVGSEMGVFVSGDVVVVGGCGGFASGEDTASPPGKTAAPAGKTGVSGGKTTAPPGKKPAPAGETTENGGATPRGCTPPILRVIDTATVEVAGNLVLSGWATVEVQSGTTIELAGDFANQSTNPIEGEGFNWSSGSLLMNAGAAGPVQRFELAGEDRGVGPAGFVDNFAMGTLQLAAGSAVEFVDEFDNVAGDGCEVLYVDTLILGADSEITLNCNVYYITLADEGAAVITASGGALICLLAGDIDCDGVLDSDDVAAFVAVLLGEDTDPAHIVSADLDHNGMPGGGDIRPFVSSVL